MDVPFLSKVFIRKLKNVLEHDIFHINHINALNHRETFHKRRERERLSLLPLYCVIPQNRVITVQTLRHKIRLHRYMKGVYDTASILAYNQRTNLQQFYVTYLSLRILRIYILKIHFIQCIIIS